MESLQTTLYQIGLESNLLMFEIESLGKNYIVNFNHELSFNDITLNRNIEEHCAKVAFFSMYYENMEYELNRKEIDFKAAKAHRWITIKEGKPDIYSAKSLSDARVDMLIESDPDLMALQYEILDMKMKVKKMREILSLFRYKKELMQTFASNIRTTI